MNNNICDINEQKIKRFSKTDILMTNKEVIDRQMTKICGSHKSVCKELFSSDEVFVLSVIDSDINTYARLLLDNKDLFTAYLLFKDFVDKDRFVASDLYLKKESKIPEVQRLVLKIYNKLRRAKTSVSEQYSQGWYLSQKEYFDKIFFDQEADVEDEEECVSKNAPRENLTPRSLKKRSFFDVKNIFEILIILFITYFLIGESRRFYQSHNLGDINSAALPVLIEFSIIMLALKQGARFKAMTFLLIFFNVVTFSYFSLKNHDAQIAKITKENKAKAYFASEKKMIEKDLDKNLESRDALQKRYNKSYDKKFITRANSVLLPQIKQKELVISKLQAKLEHINKSILEIKDSGSIATILFGTISIIVIKLLLQIVSLLLIADFRRNNTGLKTKMASNIHVSMPYERANLGIR